MRRYLQPSHEEEELEKREDWHVQVNLVAWEKIKKNNEKCRYLLMIGSNSDRGKDHKEV